MTAARAESASSRLRVPTLDAARLIAAACVVIFHFGFHGGTHGTLNAYSPSLGAWTRYGYLGVNVFFVISGFVIAWSAEGAKALDFAWRRWLRVYPTFIFCVCFTSLVVVLAHDPHFWVTPRQLLAHLIVDPRRFRIPFIDDVYWTIVSECQFYLFVALGLSIPWLRKRKTACIVAWFALTLLNEYALDMRMLRFALVSQWSSFFILGMMLFRLKTKPFSPLDAALALAALATGVHLELRDAAVRFLVAPDYSPLLVGLVLVASILLLVVSMGFRFRPSIENELRRLGAISYPLYLLHGTIGYIVINRLAPRTGLLAAIAITVVLVLALASFVAFVVEPRLKAACTKLLLRAPWSGLRPSRQALPTAVLNTPAESGLRALATPSRPGGAALVRPSLLIGSLLTIACQVSNHSSNGNDKSSAGLQREPRLVERTAADLPPTIQANYALEVRELLAPLAAEASKWQPVAGSGGGLSAAGSVFRSAVSQVRRLSAADLSPRRSYRLAFSARAIGNGEVSVGLKFRHTKGETFRTFRELVKGDAVRNYQLDFTAPVFVAAAELFVEPKGAELELAELSLRMREPVSQTEPVDSWVGSFVPPGYGLVFNDEFNAHELDRHKWFTRYIYGSETLDHLNKENQRYTDNGNHRLSEGALNLTANRLEHGQPSAANYESGMIRSDFTLTYGFLEARVKMPKGRGVWPAFWLNSDVSEKGHLSWPPEIDIFEFVNNGREDKPNQLHISATDTPGEPTRFPFTHQKFAARIKEYFAPFDFDRGFHTIGAEWTPTDVTVYVDGLKIMTSTFRWLYADGTQAGPAHVLLNLAIGDSWAGRYGVDDTAFPQALAVDWVRVYQKLHAD